MSHVERRSCRPSRLIDRPSVGRSREEPVDASCTRQHELQAHRRDGRPPRLRDCCSRCEPDRTRDRQQRGRRHGPRHRGPRVVQPRPLGWSSRDERDRRRDGRRRTPQRGRRGRGEEGLHRDATSSADSTAAGRAEPVPSASPVVGHPDALPRRTCSTGSEPPTRLPPARVCTRASPCTPRATLRACFR